MPASNSSEEDKKDHKSIPQEGPIKTNFFVYVFYAFLMTVAICYCVYLYDPEEFKYQAETLEGLKPMVTFFEFVEKYSPFHEFLLDDVDGQIAKAKAAKAKRVRVFKPEQLKLYDGSNPRKGPYLAFLGKVYDVSKGREHYGPGGGYSFFSGKDGSRAFVTGEFNEEGLTDNVSGLSLQSYLGLADWENLYQKDYRQVGFVHGRFYDEKGQPTSYHAEYLNWVKDAKAEKQKKRTESERFPPCNSKWSKKEGHFIWCSKKSGGIQRSWVGVPRRLFTPGQAERCACIKNFGDPEIPSDDVDGRDRGDLDHPHLKEYANCDPKKSECLVEPPEVASPDEEELGDLFDQAGTPHT